MHCGQQEIGGAALLAMLAGAEGARSEAGAITHHLMATTGAVYALAADPLPLLTLGRGAAYGAAVWLIADEIAVPAFRLSAPPWTSPPATHVRTLGTHVVYGAVLDACLRAIGLVVRDRRR